MAMSATFESPFSNPIGRLPRWVNAVLVVLIGIALATVTVKLLPQNFDVDTSTVDTGGGTADTAPDPLSLSERIASFHLFGNPAAPVEAPKAEPAVETRLNLQLAGVLAYEPQERAIAIISAGSAEQSAYGVGDKVSGETRLKRVYSDYVVLDNQGREEILRLPVDSRSSVAEAASAGPATAAMPASTQTASSNQDFSQPVTLPATPGALRDTLARNPSLLGRVVAAEPYQENGKLMGYRITPKQNPEILESQGIVAGDVLTRVNNIQLNSQKQGIRALRNAVKADNLEVVVLRDGVEVPLSISLAQ